MIHTLMQTGAHRIKFTYMDAPDSVRFIIPLDGLRFLCVVTDTSNGNYEWVLTSQGIALMYSDSGYGSPERALMHGLNKCAEDDYL